MLYMKRVDTSMSAIFDLFEGFEALTWLAVGAVFLAHVTVGLGARILERRYVTKAPIAPLDVSLINRDISEYSTFSFFIVCFSCKWVKATT